jgi:hypothetical protein
MTERFDLRRTFVGGGVCLDERRKRNTELSQQTYLSTHGYPLPSSHSHKTIRPDGSKRFASFGNANDTLELGRTRGESGAGKDEWGSRA